MHFSKCDKLESLRSIFSSIQDFDLILNDFVFVDVLFSEGKLFKDLVALYVNPFCTN